MTMDDDQNTPTELAAEAAAPTPESVPAPVEPESSQPNGSTPIDLPPEAPESPTDAPTPVPVESQNGGVNQPESEVPEVPISEPVQPVPVPSAPAAQAQSPAQQDQTGFIRALLAKANAKIQSNRQRKLELLMQSVSKRGKIDNREAQKFLRISDKTAERYLNKLVTQGRLKRSGAGRDVISALPR